MIGLLEGRSLDIQEKTVILSVDGVGYELSVTTEARLICEHTSTNHETVQLRVHTHVREDQFSLFGFASLRERELFRLLISVSGIGPKSALEILSAPSSEVIRALAEQDAAFLISCPGIDKKLPNVWSPSRGGKVSAWHLAGESTTSPSFRRPGGLEENYAYVIDALLRLGYDKRRVLPVLSRFVEKQGSTVPTKEETIRFCLAHL